MSLQVWLPLNKNVIENKGLSDVVFTNSNPSGITFVDSGIESCYNYDTTGGYTAKGIYSGYINQSFLDTYINHHSFSLCGWFKTSVTDVWNLPLIHITYGVGLNVGPTTRFVLSNPDRNIACNANTNTSDNTWHHVCGTYDISDNKLRIYLDGILKNTADYASGITYSIPTNWNIGAFIGKNPNDSTPQCYFDGSLSDIRIYDHALSDKEVAELAKGLMFHLKLDNTDLYDCSGYRWSVSKYSSGTLSENADTARYGKSLKFDNTYITIPYLIKYDAQEFTVSYWIKYNTLTGSPIFDAHSSLYNGCYIGMGGDGTIWMIRFDTKKQNYSPNTYSIEANRWYHVTCVYKAGQFVKVYADDKYNTYTGTDAISMADANKNYNQIASTNFDGSISDFRIYRTALTDEQVRELYKVGGSIDNHGNAHCYELNEDPVKWFMALSRGANTTNNLAYTFNSGKDWQYKTMNSDNIIVRVSQDLKRWAVSGFGATGWYSLDSGSTLTQLPIQMDYITISNGGEVITGCKSYSRKTYRLVYPFSSYTELYTATQDIWTPPTLNYDGSLIVGRTNSNKNAWAYNNGTTSVVFTGSTSMGQPDIASITGTIYLKAGTTLYESTDRGATFNVILQNIDSDISFDSGASNNVSNDGRYFIMTAQNGRKVGVFSDYGRSYRLINTEDGRITGSCSHSGRYMCYTVNTNIYVSEDYGKTFHRISTPSNLATSGTMTSVTIEDAQ